MCGTRWSGSAISTPPDVQPTLASPRQFHYRNHARFNVWRESGALGFTHRERRRFVRIDRCLLMHDGINDILAQLQGRAAETSQLSIRSSPHTGDYLVQPTLKSSEVSIHTGQKTYRESVAGQEFRVASPSFFQVNVWQAARLAELVKDALELTGDETVVDAYAGVGTFAVLLAPYARRIIAVEESTAAIADATENAAAYSNVRLATGKVEAILPGLDATPDAVILDPSRSGCQPAVLETLLALRPNRIAYVSCNPESLARDLRALSRGYQIEAIQPVDMFPQTQSRGMRGDTGHQAGHRRDRAGVPPLPAAGNCLSGLGIRLPRGSRRHPGRAGARRKSRADGSPAVARESPGRRRGGVPGIRLLRRRRQHGRPGRRVHRQAGRRRGGPIHAPPPARHRPPGDHRVHRVRRRHRPLHHRLQRRRRADCATSPTPRWKRPSPAASPWTKPAPYAIQDPDFKPASLLSGCYSNVMGLPACRIVDTLAEMGCALPDPESMNVPPGCTVSCALRPTTH